MPPVKKVRTHEKWVPPMPDLRKARADKLPRAPKIDKPTISTGDLLCRLSDGATAALGDLGTTRGGGRGAGLCHRVIVLDRASRHADGADHAAMDTGQGNPTGEADQPVVGVFLRTR